MHNASSMHVAEKAASVGRRGRGPTAYRSPPQPMPSNATDKMRPKVYEEPPRSGPSMRYHTSSISRNTPPTTAAAASTSAVGAAVDAGGAAASVSAWARPNGGAYEASSPAASATSTLSRLADQIVRLVPNASSA